MILYKWGETKLPVQNAQYGIWVTDSLMNKIGLQNGDKIEAINGEPVKYFDDISLKILLGRQIAVERNGEQKIINVPIDVIDQLGKGKMKHTPLLQPRIPVVIGGFMSPQEIAALSDAKISVSTKASNNTLAKSADTTTIDNHLYSYNRSQLKVFDKITAVDSTPVTFFDEMAPLLQQKKGDSVTLTLMRNGQQVQTKVIVDTAGKIGFYVVNDEQADSLGILKLETKKYGFLASFPAGVAKTGDQLNSYIQQFKMILNPETGAYKYLGGFKAMASVFPDSGWNWQAFWKITAFFSIILAFMNLLPIPALDGGHVIFTLVEMITGRKPSDKFLEYAQIAGMIILFALLIFANGNDWFGWGKGH
jgi:regulator of sigma E protease